MDGTAPPERNLAAKRPNPQGGDHHALTQNCVLIPLEKPAPEFMTFRRHPQHPPTMMLVDCTVSGAFLDAPGSTLYVVGRPMRLNLQGCRLVVAGVSTTPTRSVREASIF